LEPFSTVSTSSPQESSPASSQNRHMRAIRRRPSASYAVRMNKSYLVTWALAQFLGTLGIDRFYLGKIGTGILKLITAGGFGIWALIDLILVLTGNTTDKEGRPLDGFEEHKKVTRIVTIVLIVLGMISGGCSAAITAGNVTEMM